jgi:hypothetical protein
VAAVTPAEEAAGIGALLKWLRIFRASVDELTEGPAKAGYLADLDAHIARAEAAAKRLGFRVVTTHAGASSPTVQ